jgi:hypothetical protein
MLAADINDLITRTGPGTACGKLMRNYWQPAALSDELARPSPGGAGAPARRRPGVCSATMKANSA